MAAADLKLSFESRPYAGRSFRPRPEVLLDDLAHLLIVATPWGPRSAAKKAIDRMVEYLGFVRQDQEATSPFERLSCLSTLANNLRIAALLANEALYREDNQTEYHCGVELFAATMDESELVWLQLGNPNILLSRKGRPIMPVGSQIDLSFDLGFKDHLPPLPSHLLGLDSSVNLTINSFRVREGDRIVLLSHSYIPDSFFRIENDSIDLESMAAALAKSDPDAAFWLGILNVNGLEPNDELNELPNQAPMPEGM